MPLYIPAPPNRKGAGQEIEANKTYRGETIWENQDEQHEEQHPPGNHRNGKKAYIDAASPAIEAEMHEDSGRPTSHSGAHEDAPPSCVNLIGELSHTRRRLTEVRCRLRP